MLQWPLRRVPVFFKSVYTDFTSLNSHIRMENLSQEVPYISC
jgi:hypothetical protein